MTVREPRQSSRGTARGVTDDGRLIVETTTGRRYEVTSAEVAIAG